MIQRESRLTEEIAEDLALKGLQYIAGDVELLQKFIAVTGVSPKDLRKVADRRDFKVGLLEFFASDEPTLLAFAASIGENPQLISDARILLSDYPPKVQEF
ncbi:MAG: DUF3572 domain-containing protein [Rhizobiaceae bacterium]